MMMDSIMHFLHSWYGTIDGDCFGFDMSLLGSTSDEAAKNEMRVGSGRRKSAEACEHNQQDGFRIQVDCPALA